MYKYTLIVLAALIAFGCLSQPSNEKVCPDGGIVGISATCDYQNASAVSLNPDDYASTSLVLGRINYVSARNQINATFNQKNGEQSYIGISYVTANGTLIPMYYYTVDPNSPSSIEYALLGNDTVAVNITAPPVPGNYLLSISKRGSTGPEIHLASYNLTVIDRVQSVSRAYEIANLFMYDALLAEHGSISNWNVTNQSTDMGDKINVVLVGRFDVCGVDWQMNDCVRGNTAEGNFTISKKTGQIIG